MSCAVRLPPLLGMALLLAACGSTGATRPIDLVTQAERSGWIRTGRYEETARLCRDFETSYPGRAHCQSFGTTPEGRAILALVAGDPDAGRPVLLIQAGIHAGEIEGKDAGFWFLRDLLDGKAVPGALEILTIVFVPIFNVDGHERFGPGNRPNQRGPAEMGFRTTSQNINLNRDYIKADAPEMRAMLGLWRKWDPVVYVDLHATDGAKFEQDVAILVAPRAPRGDRLDDVAAALSEALQARVTKLGHLPIPFYPMFLANDDPSSGFEDNEAPPRFSQSYAAARGRLGILVETHSWHRYRERVRTTYHVLQALIERAAVDIDEWRRAEDAADIADSQLAGQEVPVDFRTTEKSHTIEFRGYRYERKQSDVSGTTYTIYHEDDPQIWNIPLRDQVVPATMVTAPRAGYLVTAGFADVVAERLDAHDIHYIRIANPLSVDAEVFRVTKAEYDLPFEGRSRARLTGGWKRERRQVAPGALWIPIAQARARLILHLLEPLAPDSLASWGFFNITLEQKEYMEAYVAEQVARDMLTDPAIKAAFDRALADPDFAASPIRRLDFFYRRHASWDERKDLLPVFRLDSPPVQ